MLLRFAEVLLLFTGYVTAQRLEASTKASMRRRALPTSNKQVSLDLVRTNNGDRILLNPLKGRMFPYFHNIAFNEPCLDPKGIKIAVDTGSSDFWIDSSVWCNCNRAVVPVNKAKCDKIDAQRAAGDFRSITYDDGFAARGNFVNMDLFFDKSSLRDIGFLAAYDYDNRPTGINAITGSIGLGYMVDQALEDKNGNKREEYPTLPVVLERNGNTTSNAYSMWFRPTEAKADFAATIMFGGYPRNYFKGDLTTFPILRDVPGIVILLDQISFDGSLIFSRCKKEMQVMLDTGTFGMYLPHDTFEALVNSIGPYDFTENKIRKIAVFRDCSKIDLKRVLTFTFDNIDISLPIGDIIRPVTQKEVDDAMYPSRQITDTSKHCITHGAATWPAQESQKIKYALSGKYDPRQNEERTAILGLTFLRNAFILYDIPQIELALAPIDREAIRTQDPERVTFVDIAGSKHQEQPGYNPYEAEAMSCPIR